MAVSARKAASSPILFLLSILMAGGVGWGGMTFATSGDLQEIKDSISSVEESQSELTKTMSEIREGSLLAGSERGQLDVRISKIESDHSDLCKRVRELELERAAREGGSVGGRRR